MKCRSSRLNTVEYQRERVAFREVSSEIPFRNNAQKKDSFCKTKMPFARTYADPKIPFAKRISEETSRNATLSR